MRFMIECLKGVLIGIANAIPGVSGGTMMVSMGIYDKIIASVTGLLKHIKQSIVTLLPYIIGMLVGIVGLSFSITFLLERYPLQMSLLFIGLILGGLPILTAHIRKKSIHISHILIFFCTFAGILLLQVLGSKSFADTTISGSVVEIIPLFFVGVIAAATMVIPGVSGSMILMILGYYYPILSLVKECIKALVAFDIKGVLHTLVALVPFGFGVILGIFVIAKLIKLLLEQFESHTYCGILGLVVASPFAILMSNKIQSLSVVSILTGLFFLGVGLVASYLLGKE